MQAHCWQFDHYNTPTKALRLVEQELESPGAGSALVKIRAVGLNRSEFNYVQGHYVPAPFFPSCLGQEAVGEIVALGPGDPAAAAPYASLSVGQRVALLPGRIDLAAMGSYRDYGLYAQNELIPVPSIYSDAEGAGLWMGVLTMAGALDLAGIRPLSAAGKTVLITAAASSMGVIGLKLARCWGATTIATTRDESKLAALAELADHALLCQDSTSLAREVAKATAEGGFDAALDPVGEHFYAGLMESAAYGASIVSYEKITGGEPAVPIITMMMKELSLKGYTIFRPLREPALLRSLIDTGMHYAAEIRPLIAREFPLAAAPRALAELGQGNHIGKIVLRV